MSYFSVSPTNNMVSLSTYRKYMAEEKNVGYEVWVMSLSRHFTHFSYFHNNYEYNEKH